MPEIILNVHKMRKFNEHLKNQAQSDGPTSWKQNPQENNKIKPLKLWRIKLMREKASS